MVGSVPLYGLISLTLVGSVHFVNGGVDPWWDPSTLWTCISLTLVGSVHFLDGGVDPWWGPFHFVDL